MFWQLKEVDMQKHTTYRGSTFADIDFSDFSSFILKIPVQKVVIDEEELHGIELDDILNLDNLSRTVFID